MIEDTTQQERIERTLVAWTTEAIDLRFGEANDPEGVVRLPDFNDGTRAVVASLGRVRKRLDRVEEIRSKLTQLKGRLHREQLEVIYQAEMALHTAARRNAANRVPFQSSDERKAEAALDSMTEKRAAHLAKMQMERVEEAVQVINDIYWGLGKLREDHKSMLQAIQGVTSIEQ